MYFPGAIVRVNKALPDQLYTSGSHVMLSGNVSASLWPGATGLFMSSCQDSMFYQWHLHRSKFTSCYIDSVVPTPDDGLVANKTYSSSGSLTEIQVWNVTTPAEPMRSLSWNTRPQRVALMGTVAFLPESEKIKQLQFEDGWQSRLPTRFSCGEKATITIEVACDGCRLEFEQLFSDPPLGECNRITSLRCPSDALRSIRPDADRIMGHCRPSNFERSIRHGSQKISVT